MRGQNVKWGQFEEILKVVDPKTTVAAYARDFVIGQGLRAVGTPEVVADILEELHAETGANGGFILSKGFRVPGYLKDFTSMVVPELQRRGLTKDALHRRDAERKPDALMLSFPRMQRRPT